MNELEDVNIRHFKLASGEELVSYVQGEEKSMIILESPMELHSVMKDETQAFIFTKWQPLAKSEVCALNPMHIVSHVECDDDIKERYIRMCMDYEDDPERTDLMVKDDNTLDATDDELDELENMLESKTSTLH